MNDPDEEGGRGPDNLEIVRLLLNSGASPTEYSVTPGTNLDGVIPLHTACLYGYLETISLLLDKMGDISDYFPSGLDNYNAGFHEPLIVGVKELLEEHHRQYETYLAELHRTKLAKSRLELLSGSGAAANSPIRAFGGVDALSPPAMVAPSVLAAAKARAVARPGPSAWEAAEPVAPVFIGADLPPPPMVPASVLAAAKARAVARVLADTREIHRQEQAAAAAAATAAAAAAAMPMMQSVPVPEGKSAGDTFYIEAPDGREIVATVPEDATAGQTIDVDVGPEAQVRYAWKKGMTAPEKERSKQAGIEAVGALDQEILAKIASHF
jgi:hypothetical protein